MRGLFYLFVLCLLFSCNNSKTVKFAVCTDIHYIGLNSLSYAWVGKKGEYTGRFPKDIEEKYPNLKYTLPYRDAVFAMVKIKADGKIEIGGIRSDFIQPGPQKLSLGNTEYSAKITNRILEF